MTQNKIFADVNKLIASNLAQVNNSLSAMSDFLEQQNIPLTTKLKDSDKDIGSVLITAALNLSEFLKGYADLKDTWVVTDPSLVLDDEK